MTETTVLKLGFITDTEKSNLVNVKAPKEDLTDLQVKTQMDNMLLSAAVSSRNGAITEKKYARLVTVTATDIELPA